ncbi:hypothetical protein P8452_72153 [Trifolium repens]|nr:hypothetical protein P8452_72153 [Trifolium repens]
MGGGGDYYVMDESTTEKRTTVLREELYIAWFVESSSKAIEVFYLKFNRSLEASITISTGMDRSWMKASRLSAEYKDGVMEFLEFAEKNIPPPKRLRFNWMVL